MEEFHRIKRLPPYVFSIIDEMKFKARRKGEDIIDLGMGNPDLETPKPIVDKLVEAVKNPKNHRYSVSRGIYKLRIAISNWYKNKYGLDIKEYDRMFKKQDGKCAICKKPETRKRKDRVLRLAVDHNHRTGNVRGLLCHKCNAGIGNLNDSSELLKNAIRYLEEYKNK